MLCHHLAGGKPIKLCPDRQRGLQRQSGLQIVEKPAAGRTGFMVCHARGVDCQGICRVAGIFGKIDLHQIAGREVLDDQMARHPAPTEPRQQKVQSAAQVDEAPPRRACQTVVVLVPIDWIGQAS